MVLKITYTLKIMCMGVWLHLCLCATCMPCAAYKGQKKASDHLMGLQVLESHHVDAGK